MKHATKRQGNRNLLRFLEQKAAQSETAHDRFIQKRINSFKLGARIAPEVFNALQGTFLR
jgi:hypothetical protein